MKNKTYHPKNTDDFLSRHHCYPLARLSSNNPPKVKHRHLTIKLWRSRHTNWHLLFHNATIDEVIYRLSWDRHIYSNQWYSKVFKCDRLKASEILKRLKQIKTSKLWNTKKH